MKTELFRSMASEQISLQEAAYDSKTGELTITVIKPGMSKNKRFYPAEVLRKSAPIFEGAKMFADHQSDKEAKERPEGSVNNWVANVKNVWPESDGTLKARAVVIDPPFKAKLDKLAEAGMLKEMGVSIRAVGEARDVKQDGESFKMIESLIAARSIDFVTYAGAGGHVETMESANDENDVDLIGEADFRKRRPDLVEIIESSAHGDEKVTLEQQLQEAKDQLAAKTAELATASADLKTANDKLQESETTAKKATAAAELTRLLTEAKLPEVAAKRMQKLFAEATDVAGMKEAVEDEKEYLKSLGTTQVKNMGRDTQISEGDAAATQKAIKESFMAAGLSEKDAEMAAAGRR